MLKARGDIADAIDVLEKKNCYKDEDGNPLTFQQVHALDLNTFKELTSLYLQLGNIDKALFYAEECILCDPYDSGLHCRHGEIAYSNQQHERAIAAFSQSLRLSDGPNNARAAYGLLMSAGEALKALKGGKKGGGGGSSASSTAQQQEAQERLEALRSLAQDILRGMYSNSSMAHLLDLTLKKLSQ